tara:strand:+ start:223 stop:1602 length:1380 start_codon:yes stop_codon:yes gene_type:complete
MVDPVSPRREQLASVSGGDNRLLIALERLFEVAGKITPELIAANTEGIAENLAAITANAENIVINSDDITAIETAIPALLDQDIIFINAKSQLPDPVGGVITLQAGRAYYFLGEVDLTGDRLVCGGILAIQGSSSETSKIISTGLTLGTALLTSAYTLPMRHITLSAATILNLDATSNPTSAIDWYGVNLSDSADIGLIKNYSNFVVSSIAVLNASGLVFGGTTGTIAFSDSIFVGQSSGAIVTLADTMIVTRRFRVKYSAFIATGASVALNVSTLATIPVEGYILDTCNFSGGGTYTGGVQYDDRLSFFTGNVGISNSTSVAVYYMLGNTTATTITTAGVPVKASGVTTSGASSQGFTMTNNRATYSRGVGRTFHISVIVTVTGSNNVQVGTMIAVNGTVLADTRQGTTANSAGRDANVSAQGSVGLVEGDYVEVFVENEGTTTDLTVEGLHVIINAT